MKRISLLDTAEAYNRLLPLCYTRPVSQLPVGIFTNAELWQILLPGEYGYSTDSNLSALFPALQSEPQLTIMSEVVPSKLLAQAIDKLRDGEQLVDSTGRRIAYATTGDGSEMVFNDAVDYIDHPYNLFLLAAKGIELGFDILTAGSESQPLSDSCTLIGSCERLFIGEGAEVEGATINTRTGAVYIGAGAKVMEGSCLRGPIYIAPGAIVKMGAKIYGATSIGAHCKVGGELNNVVMLRCSNKGHDGFLGNAVVGSWCNLGAGCSASNLKNDYSEIKLWDYNTGRFQRTGLQFCGLIMGDHSKAGINTMFNTATVVGVGCNIHGSGFPRNFVESFSEGGPNSGFGRVPLKKFFQIADRVMERRGEQMSEAEKQLFERLYNL